MKSANATASDGNGNLAAKQFSSCAPQALQARREPPPGLSRQIHLWCALAFHQVVSKRLLTSGPSVSLPLQTLLKLRDFLWLDAAALPPAQVRAHVNAALRTEARACGTWAGSRFDRSVPLQAAARREADLRGI